MERLISSDWQDNSAEGLIIDEIDADFGDGI
jgi:hypothetical protein